MFSLEGREGLRFLTRSRLYTGEEWAELPRVAGAPAPKPESPPPSTPSI
jgi:hypothetical protein